MSIREDVELYTKLSGEDGSRETIGTIGAYLRGYRQGKENAEPQERTGRWIPDKRYESSQGFYEAYCCSECGYTIGWREHSAIMTQEHDEFARYFCPHCGARMEGTDG